MLVGITLLAICCYVLVHAVYSLLFHPLRQFPGPKLWAITQLPWLATILSGRTHLVSLELHRRYGPIVRLTPNQLSYMDPAAWQAIMGHRKHGQVENLKDPIYANPSSNHIIGADREGHGRMRRVMAHGFSASTMIRQTPLIMSYVDKLFDKLQANADNGEEYIDIAAWYNYTTFDIIGDLAFGQSFGCLDDGSYHPWVAMIFSTIKISKVSQVFRNYPVLMPLLLLFTSTEMRRKAAAARKISHETLSRRLASDVERPDFIQALMSKDGKVSLTEEEVRANADVITVAGSETTATALCGATYLLAKHPQVMARMVEEVRSSFTDESEIDLLSTPKLPYMNAVIEEALRLYPPTPNSQPRITPVEGDTILGHKIPGKTVLNIPHWAMYHSESNFKQPMDFCPERWIGAPEFADDRTEGFQPFSFGPRSCIGKNLAYAEMRTVLARLCWNFDGIILSESCQNWMDQKAYGVWEKPALEVRFVSKNGRRTSSS